MFSNNDESAPVFLFSVSASVFGHHAVHCRLLFLDFVGAETESGRYVLTVVVAALEQEPALVLVPFLFSVSAGGGVLSTAVLLVVGRIWPSCGALPLAAP